MRTPLMPFFISSDRPARTQSALLFRSSRERFAAGDPEVILEPYHKVLTSPSVAAMNRTIRYGSVFIQRDFQNGLRADLLSRSSRRARSDPPRLYGARRH